uniref:Uncharacterized protein n=1 Tax=Arundo donax TaxID=35708 RepID=A0A0A9GHF9_ARUDO
MFHRMSSDPGYLRTVVKKILVSWTCIFLRGWLSRTWPLLC